jgi:hypothetical protein
MKCTARTCRGPSQVRFISDQTPLNEVFKIFKTSFSHLMMTIAFFDPDSGERLSQEEIIQRSKAKDTRALSIRQVRIACQGYCQHLLRRGVFQSVACGNVCKQLPHRHIHHLLAKYEGVWTKWEDVITARHQRMSCKLPDSTLSTQPKRCSYVLLSLLRNCVRERLLGPQQQHRSANPSVSLEFTNHCAVFPL